MISTMDGGMIWPRVPDAAMVPDAGRGRQQRANENHRDAQPAGDRSEQLGHGNQQILGDPRALQHDAHEHEQRNRDQGVALDLPVDAPEVGDPGGQPLDRAALGEVGAGIVGEEIAGQGGRADRQDRRARQRECDRKPGAQGRGH
jgi:hypothetical protein